MPVKRTYTIPEVFDLLFQYYGPLAWWPAETPFEVCVGAILTQNTAWSNVEKAIFTLKQANLLTPDGIRQVRVERLAGLIRPAGYFNLKSSRLKDFVTWLFERYGGSLELMFSGDWQELRRELLEVRGIGPETCDSILLYAGGKPSFVVDAYTRRLFHRLGLLPERIGYDEIRSQFQSYLPADRHLFNEYHALIVEQCKLFCRKKPVCRGCPLFSDCPSSSPV